MTLVAASSGPSELVSWLAGEFHRGARVDANWQWPLKLARVNEDLGMCSFEKLAAWLATGVCSGLEEALTERVRRVD
jgi:hypothetical protein